MLPSKSGVNWLLGLGEEARRSGLLKQLLLLFNKEISSRMCFLYITYISEDFNINPRNVKINSISK